MWTSLGIWQNRLLWSNLKNQDIKFESAHLGTFFIKYVYYLMDF